MQMNASVRESSPPSVPASASGSPSWPSPPRSAARSTTPASTGLIVFPFVTVALAGLAWLVALGTDALGNHVGPG